MHPFGCAAGSYFCHSSRFRKPPSHPGRSDFPSPVGSSSMSPEDLPPHPEAYTLARIHPLDAWLYLRLDAHCGCHRALALCPDGVSDMTPATYREPLRPSRALPASGGCPAPPQRVLPLLHRSYGLMRPTTFLSRTEVFTLYRGALQVAASPCWKVVVPDVISAIRAEALGPIPRRDLSVHVPVASRSTSASRHV